MVSRDGHRLDFLLLAGVFTDLVLGQRGAADQLVFPLPPGDGVGDQDERGGLRLGHRGGADERFARAAGQDHDAGTAGPEGLGGVVLVVAQGPAVFNEFDWVGLAVDVSGEVLCRPADLVQLLLEPAALGGRDCHGVVIDPCAQHPADLLVAGNLLQDCRLGRFQDQPVSRMLVDAHPAIPRHRLGDIDKQSLRNREARVVLQHVHDLLRIVAGGAGVPQRQRRDAVGVDVLRGPLQFGERGQGRAGLIGTRVIHLQEHRFVGLDDERACGHRQVLLPSTPFTSSAPASRSSCCRC